MKKLPLPLARWRLFILGLGLMIGVSATSQVIPVNRTLGGSGGWEGYVGVPGGIPYRTNIYATISAGASVATVQSAINNCPSNGVVYLSAGTYTWSTSLNMKTGVTLRGAGTGLTIINSTANNAIFFQGYNSLMYYGGTGTRVNWTGGYNQGTNVITLSSTSGLVVGENIWLDQLNDGDTDAYGCNPGYDPGVYSTPSYPSTGQDRLQFQMDMVTAINGNSVTLAEPVYAPFWNASNSPQAWWEGGFPMAWAGCEDFTINCTAGAQNSLTGIWGDGLYACWLKNINLTGYRFFTSMSVGTRCETRHCMISNYGNTDCYGFYPKFQFGGLYVDNIGNNCGTIFMIQSCAGCAFAYNYTTNAQNVSTYLSLSYYCHGGNPNMLLFEGNWGPCFGMDNMWGTASYNTGFRNRFTGNADSPIGSTGNTEAVADSYINRHMSLIGNVLGTSGYNTIYQETVTNCTGNPRVYFFGGNNGCSGSDDPATRATALLEYNWTSATLTNNGIVAGGISSSQVPASLLYASAPTNFGILKWPPVDPQNVAYSISRTNIPAAYRFIFGVDPPQNTAYQPPVVVATATPQTGVAPLSVTYSSIGTTDPLRQPMTYNWNFGDGTTSTNANPGHVYPTAGTYTAKLTVSDSTSNTVSQALIITVSAAITNQPPVITATAAPQSGLTPLSVAFSSAGTFDPQGQTLLYNWNFGDGVTSTNANPSHIYTTAGTYTVRLTVSDGITNATSGGITITVNPYLAPTVVASASPLTGVMPLAVTFSSAGTTDPQGKSLTFSWDFGDGTTSTIANPGHTYTTAGSYTVWLTVADGTTNAISGSLNIVVSAAPTNLPPVAVASANPASGSAPLTVTFSSSGSFDPEGAALAFNWVFGDGSTSSLANPSHTYTNAAIYPAQLTVTDGTNSTTVSNITVNVTGLVAAFGFEGTNGSTVLDTVTGLGEGTITNASIVSGKFGSALAFNGTNSVVAVSSSAVSALTSNMTIEAWVNPATTGNSWRPVIGKSSNGSQLNYVVQGATPQNGVPALYVAPSSSNLYGSTPLPTNTWSHIAVTYNGTTLCLYVNGVLVSSQAQSGAPTPSTVPLTIGSDGLLQAFWNGAIDEVRIYNVAVNAAQIQTDMNSPIVSIPVPPQNLRVMSP